MRYLKIACVCLAVAAILAGCTESDPLQAAQHPLNSWSFAGIEHPVISGIAGAQPDYWLDRGWEGEATLVYLVDREIGCDEFPFVGDPNAFPPRLVDEGAYMTLRFVTESSNNMVNYTSFDIESIGSSTGRGTSDVEGRIEIVDPGDSQRIHGWMNYEFPGDGSRSAAISANVSFDVPFCS